MAALKFASYQALRDTASSTVDPNTGLVIPVFTGGGPGVAWRDRTSIARDISRSLGNIAIEFTGNWGSPL